MISDVYNQKEKNSKVEINIEQIKNLKQINSNSNTNITVKDQNNNILYTIISTNNTIHFTDKTKNITLELNLPISMSILVTHIINYAQGSNNYNYITNYVHAIKTEDKNMIVTGKNVNEFKFKIIKQSTIHDIKMYNTKIPTINLLNILNGNMNGFVGQISKDKCIASYNGQGDIIFSHEDDMKNNYILKYKKDQSADFIDVYGKKKHYENTLDLFDAFDIAAKAYENQWKFILSKTVDNYVDWCQNTFGQTLGIVIIALTVGFIMFLYIYLLIIIIKLVDNRSST